MADEFSWSAEQEQEAEFLFHPVGAAILGFIFTLPVACVLHALNWRNLGNISLYRANLRFAVIWLSLVGVHIIYVCNLYIKHQRELAKLLGHWGEIIYLLCFFLLWLLLLGNKQIEFMQERKFTYQSRNMFLALFAAVLWLIVLAIFSGLLGYAVVFVYLWIST